MNYVFPNICVLYNRIARRPTNLRLVHTNMFNHKHVEAHLKP